MANRLSISIVIPVYNEEHYLKSCLDSIIGQTIAPDEVILVDNNSTDGSMKIAESFPCVKILYESRQGVAYARDKGFDAVSSELIGRIDADTQLPDDWVETVLNMFQEEPDMAAVSGPTGFYDMPKPWLTLRLTKIIRTTLFYVGRSSNKYLFGSNMALRTKAWRAVSKEVCHIPGNHEDNDLAIHIEDAGYKVHYSNRLTAMISVRRADSKFGQALWYAFSEYRTYRSHGIISLHAWAAGAILLSVYLPLKILRRAYDDKQKRYSFKKLIKHATNPRPHPMQ